LQNFTKSAYYNFSVIYQTVKERQSDRLRSSAQTITTATQSRFNKPIFETITVSKPDATHQTQQMGANARKAT